MPTRVGVRVPLIKVAEGPISRCGRGREEAVPMRNGRTCVGPPEFMFRRLLRHDTETTGRLGECER